MIAVKQIDMPLKSGLSVRRKALGLAMICGVSLFAMGGLSACSSLSWPFTTAGSVDLTQSSYTAADMLLQQSKNILTPQTPLQIGVLTNIKRPSETTALGQMVASQIGARFVQLGYNVSITPYQGGLTMATAVGGGAGATGTYGGSAAAAMQGMPMQGQAIITGHYAIARHDVLINLRIIDQTGGRVLAAYDYTLPLDSDIKELISKEPAQQ